MSDQTPKPSPLMAQLERRLSPEPLPPLPDTSGIHDPRTRIAVLRGEQEPPPPPKPEDEPDPIRRQWLELRRTNPVVAARFAARHRLHDR